MAKQLDFLLSPQLFKACFGRGKANSRANRSGNSTRFSFCTVLTAVLSDGRSSARELWLLSERERQDRSCEKRPSRGTGNPRGRSGCVLRRRIAPIFSSFFSQFPFVTFPMSPFDDFPRVFFFFALCYFYLFFLCFYFFVSFFLLFFFLIFSFLIGKDHISQATCINELAQLYFLEENFSEAELLCRRLVRIVDRFIGPESVEVAICYMNLGCVLEFREAELTIKPERRGLASEYSSPTPRASQATPVGLRTPRSRLAQSLQPFPSTQSSISRSGSNLSATGMGGKSPKSYRGRISARIGTDPHSPRMSNTLSVRGLLEDLENEDNPEYLYDRPNTSGRRINAQVMKQLEEALECYENALKILQTELKQISARTGADNTRPSSRSQQKVRLSEAGKKSKKAINFLLGHLLNQISYVKDSLGRHDESKVHNYESLLHFKRSILGEQRSKAAQAAHLRQQFHMREEKKTGFDVKRAILGTPPSKEVKKADDLEILTLNSPAEVAWEISYEQCMFERLEFSSPSSVGFRETLPLEYVDRIMRTKLRHREALQRTRMLETLRREREEHRF